MISSEILFKLSSGCSKSLKNQNIFSKANLLEDAQFLSFSFSCLLFLFLQVEDKIDNWSRDTHAHLWRAHSFQVLLFSNNHCTSLCLHPSNLNLFSNNPLKGKLDLWCKDVKYVYLISKYSKLKFKYHTKTSLKLQLG